MHLQKANTKAKRMVVSDFHLYEEFYTHKDIVFEKDGKKYLHTFNYLFQDIANKPYLIINDACFVYNELVFQNETFGFEVALEYLKTEGFNHYITQKTLHRFTNENLEMDFYPAIKGTYLKDNEGNHYMLVAVQNYQKEDFTTPLLFQFSEPSFSFPHQDNYIR